MDELLADHRANVERLTQKISALEIDPLLSQELTPLDPNPTIEADAEVAAIQGKIVELQGQLDATQATTPSNNYATEEQEWTTKKSELERRLYVRSTIASAHKRITEIENSIKTKGQTLLNLERDLNTIKEIQKAKALSVEERINSMFSIVRFKMVADQINGGDRQVCETTVGGVPYASLNNAARINAGLDIINAFCRFNGTTAPVFVDNAEAVNELLPMESQVISLIVTNDKQLIVR